MFTDKIDIFGMHVIIPHVPETTGMARRTDYLYKPSLQYNSYTYIVMIQVIAIPVLFGTDFDKLLG